MKTMKLVVAGIVAASLAGCGADEIASPGSGGNITINYPPGTGNGGGGNGGGDTGGDGLVEPAAGCPTIANPVGLTDSGTITGPTGTYRVCTLPERFTVSSTLNRVAGLLYAMDGRVDVGYDQGATDDPSDPEEVTLTIRPGVVLYARTGVSWMVVNRGNRIEAVGAPDRPIVFTSRENVIGATSDGSHQQWGGLVLLGRAPVTDCTVSPGAAPGTVDCERQTEGAADPAYFGGATPDDDSGTLRYVQIRYSGYALSGDSELQSLTLGGVGTGTDISYIHSHNSSDDGFEAFGGTVNLFRFVITGADDDSIDVDTGYRGVIQHVIAIQKSMPGDSMIELDTTNALEAQQPRTHLKLANFTLVHRNPANSNDSAIRIRGAADVSLVNGIVTSPTFALRADNNTGAGVIDILGEDASVGKEQAPLFRSVLFQSGAATGAFRNGSGGVDAAAVQTLFTSGTNTNNNPAHVSTLDGFMPGSNELNAIATDPTTVDARFEATDYVGAVNGPGDTWFRGWTCDSETADFGSGSACTSLPSLED